mgnify:CR=1 FL=1
MIIIAIIAFIVLCIRCTVQPALDFSDTYKNLAHLFIGGLFGAGGAFWYARNHFLSKDGGLYRLFNNLKNFFFGLAIGMTIFETVAGVLGKQTGKSLIQLIFG